MGYCSHRFCFMATIKQQRTAEGIKQIVSEVLMMEVSDPRLFGLTVTSVDIDRELSHANIYVGALGEEARKDEVVAALKHANGFFRSQVARRMRLRSTPLLHFHWDPTLERVDRIETILGDLDIPPAEVEED